VIVTEWRGLVASGVVLAVVWEITALATQCTINQESAEAWILGWVCRNVASLSLFSRTLAVGGVVEQVRHREVLMAYAVVRILRKHSSSYPETPVSAYANRLSDLVQEYNRVHHGGQMKLAGDGLGEGDSDGDDTSDTGASGAGGASEVDSPADELASVSSGTVITFRIPPGEEVASKLRAAVAASGGEWDLLSRAEDSTADATTTSTGFTGSTGSTASKRGLDGTTEGTIDSITKEAKDERWLRDAKTTVGTTGGAAGGAHGGHGGEGGEGGEGGGGKFGRPPPLAPLEGEVGGETHRSGRRESVAPPGMTKKTDSPLKMQIDKLREKQQKQEEMLKRRKEQQMAEMAGDTGDTRDAGGAAGREVTVEHPLLGTSCIR
jgi:hypothetical protein